MSDENYDAQLRLASRLRPDLAPRTITPTDASVKLTENCQARCVTCDYWKDRHVNHLDTEAAIRLLDRLGELGITTLRLTGGEPLLRRDLFDVLQRARTDRFAEISLQTNGLLLKRRAARLNASPISHVTISLDATGAANDGVRGVPGYFDRAVSGVEQLEGKTVIVAVTLTALAADHLDGLIDLVERHGGYLACNLPDDRLYFLRNADLAGLWPSAAATERIVDTLGRRLGHQFEPYELDYVRRYLAEGAPATRSINPPCVLGYTNVYVASDGGVRSGCYALEPLGNVLEQDLAAILSSDAYRRRCEEMLRLECPGCACNAFRSLRVHYAPA